MTDNQLIGIEHSLHIIVVELRLLRRAVLAHAVLTCDKSTDVSELGGWLREIVHQAEDAINPEAQPDGPQ
jgi:hypothetical protein